MITGGRMINRNTNLAGVTGFVEVVRKKGKQICQYCH